MASTPAALRLLLTLLLVLLVSSAPALSSPASETVVSSGGGGMELPIAMSMYGGGGEFEDEEEEGGEKRGRELYWRRWPHYYISYGALSANRVPCPPRSGRSYYTHNCFKTRTPVNPYTRGCSRIARCRS